jgi:DNA-binding transcriptional MerR regulator
MSAVDANDERPFARAFTSKKVMALTGLSARQLQYWDEQGFLSPSLRRREGKGRRRLYDFRDLVSLRVAAQLRQTVTLQLIRRAVEHLRALDYEAPLSTQRWWAVNGELYFQEANQVRGAREPGQAIVEGTIDLPVIVHDLERAIVKLDERPHGKVERRRGVLGSKPRLSPGRGSRSSLSNGFAAMAPMRRRSSASTQTCPRPT